jgi:hypothetical protein
MTICCSLTRPRWSAPAAARRSSAQHSVTLRTMATARAIPGSSGVSGCTQSSPPDRTLRAVTVASPKRDEREVALELLLRTRRRRRHIDRRQELRGEGIRAGRERHERDDPASPPQRRARERPTPHTNLPTSGEHLLELQGNPDPRARRVSPTTATAATESPRPAGCAGERSSAHRSARRPAQRCAAPSSGSRQAASALHRAAVEPAARRSRGAPPRPGAARADRPPCPWPAPRRRTE